MTLKQYIIAMIFGTGLSGATVSIILFLVNPDEVGPLAAAALLLAIGLAVTGTLTLFGLIARIFVLRQPRLPARQVRVSFRQGALVSLLIVIALILSHQKIFAWWSIMLAVGVLGIAEYFFLSGEEPRSDEWLPDEEQQ